VYVVAKEMYRTGAGRDADRAPTGGTVRGDLDTPEAIGAAFGRAAR